MKSNSKFKTQNLKFNKVIYLLILLITFCGLFYFCNQQKTDENKELISTQNINNPQSAENIKNKDSPLALPEFLFEKEIHDFGQITEGEIVTYAFKFKNIGKSNLIISSANAGCGCTIPKWPKEPIPPGKSDIIEIVFNSTGRVGYQENAVRIIANTIPNTNTIKITATVIKKEKK